MPKKPHPSMPPKFHHNMPPYLYPIITPHKICLCTYCTSTLIYAPYVFPDYFHSPPLGYLMESSSRLTSSVLTLNYSKILLKRVLI